MIVIKVTYLLKNKAQERKFYNLKTAQDFVDMILKNKNVTNIITEKVG